MGRRPRKSGSRSSPNSFPPDVLLMAAHPSSSSNSGAYRLHIMVSRAAWIRVGARGRYRIPPGRYLYVGSARRNLTQRVARHQQIARGERRGGHWHIDGLLAHRYAKLVHVDLVPGGEECLISHSIAVRSGIEVPIPKFGATDCRAGCLAHLYRVPASMALDT